MTIIQRLNSPTPEKYKKLGNQLLLIAGVITVISGGLATVIPAAIVTYISIGSGILGALGKFFCSLQIETSGN